MQTGALLADRESIQITYLDEYYLTNDEIEILQAFSAVIASKIPDGSMVIELGSGCGHPLLESVPPSLAPNVM